MQSQAGLVSSTPSPAVTKLKIRAQPRRGIGLLCRDYLLTSTAQTCHRTPRRAIKVLQKSTSSGSESHDRLVGGNDLLRRAHPLLFRPRLVSLLQTLLLGSCRRLH